MNYTLLVSCDRDVCCNCACVLFYFIKEEVLAPPPENDDVVNDFDIEEEVIEVENRSGQCVCAHVRVLDLYK